MVTLLKIGFSLRNFRGFIFTKIQFFKKCLQKVANSLESAYRNSFFEKPSLTKLKGGKCDGGSQPTGYFPQYINMGGKSCTQRVRFFTFTC